MEFRYPAIRTTQSNSDKRLVLFAAPAHEIDLWSGVPQKKKFGEDAESAGFQREQNENRIGELTDFYSNEENIVQNPLLCALRALPTSRAIFESRTEGVTDEQQFGDLVIEVPNLNDLPLVDILGQIRANLEGRVPELAGTKPSTQRIQELKMLAEEGGEVDSELISHDQTEAVGEYDESEDTDASAGSVLFEESHIFDFWEEVAARHEILKELGPDFDSSALVGFTKEALIGYLKPIVLVDGQHRLVGALRAAEEWIATDEVRKELEERIASGEEANEVHNDLITKKIRRLPVSLLMSDAPEEQVFQFVVVNQKATPVGASLLGTIVSTSLSTEELGNVANRLKNAGIRLEESQAITYLSRHEDSPFYDLVERGLAGDRKERLSWSVFGSLIRIFRDLNGGRLFGQKNDYAARWREKFLAASPIVADFREEGFDSEYEYWRSLQGPWRAVFVRFWTEVKDRFANVDDPDKHNYWGKPRTSNLFNKISLTILAADFFAFLVDTRQEIEDTKKIHELVDIWLEDVNLGYFDKDWDLSGVKKDSVGIRNQWAALWSEYRRSPTQLPDKRLFRQARNV